MLEIVTKPNGYNNDSSHYINYTSEAESNDRNTDFNIGYHNEDNSCSEKWRCENGYPSCV